MHSSTAITIIELAKSTRTLLPPEHFIMPFRKSPGFEHLVTTHFGSNLKLEAKFTGLAPRWREVIPPQYAGTNRR